MRLDKFLSETKTLTRTEASKAVKQGRITVNGTVASKPNLSVDPEKDEIAVSGRVIEYNKYRYIMLNKPEGYVSATDDKSAPFVTQLLSEELQKFELFPVGRLDKYTVGLMILTDDGQLAHRVLSPKHHAEKVYYFRCEKPLERIDELEAGVHIEGGYLTKPCKVKKLSENEAEITLTEGKYHQIKQMLYAVGNKITYLERISFADIPLDPTLERGEWRFLTENEIEKLRRI
ncbi:MAG: rRNA pseudouridine synthase [Ruminococcaceae bacterium]|nr:rRNA pseudouridine synthase [Oscillospiraceae bacterium]